MNRTPALLLALLGSCSCVAAEEPPIPPPEEAKPPETTAPEARKVLDAAAKRQGTSDRTGEKGVKRFVARFEKIFILDPEKGNHQLDLAVQAFAEPAAAGGKTRVRSEGAADGVTTVLGHNGRYGWIWTKKDGTRRFTDPVRDEADLGDLENRSRMLRLALRVFFLGNLATDRVPARLLADEEAVFPVGREGKTRKVRCRVLERAADPESGEPPVRVHLDAATLDPVAALFPSSGEKEPGWLLVLDYDLVLESARRPGAVPEGMRVPSWIEMFEVPTGKNAAPVLRIQASVDGLVVDATSVPDSIFEPPAGK